MVAVARPHAVMSGLPAGLGYTAGKWYGPSIVSGSYAANTLSADLDFFVPFLCRKTTTFDRIAIYNTAAVTVNLRMGIYADDGGGHPGALVTGSDPGQLTTSGAAGDNANTISVSLSYGTLYWLAFNSAGLAVQTITSTANDWANLSDLALPSAISTGTGTCKYGSRALAAMPATATAITATNGFIPLIRLRAA